MTADELRTQIKALPDEAKAELAKAWPRKRDGSKVPGLGTDHEHTVTELELIEQAIVSVTPFEDSPGPDPERVAELEAKLKSLPSDLYDRVTREGVAANVPNLGSPALTDEHLDTLDGLLEQALGVHFTRVLSMGRAVESIPPLDNGKGEEVKGTGLLEALCAFVTGMKERDPNRLTFEQARDLEAATRLIAHGALEVTQTNGGKPQVSLAIDWKGEAKRRDQSQRDLLVHAKGIAERLGLPVPKNLTELRPAVIYELLPWEAREAEEFDSEPIEAPGTGHHMEAIEVPLGEVGVLEAQPEEILGVVEEVRRLPGALAARVVLRVPLELVEQIPEKLYVRRVS